jgi:hypothetical protein
LGCNSGDCEELENELGKLIREIKSDNERYLRLLGILTMILKTGARLSGPVHPDVVWVLYI